MMGGRFIVVLFGFVSTIIISRGLGVEGQGHYTILIFTANLLFVVFNMGLPSSGIYFIAKRQINKRLYLISYQALSIFGAGIYLVYISVYKDDYIADIGISVLVVLIFYSKMIFSYFQSVQLAHEKISLYNSGITLQAATFFLFVMGLSTYTVELHLGEVLAIFLLSLILSIGFCLYKGKADQNFKSGENSSLSKIINYGLNAHFNNVIAFLIYRIDLMIITYYLGVKAVGIYSISIVIVENILLIATTTGSTLLSRMVNTKNIDVEAVYSIAKVVMVITFIGCLFFWFLSKEIVQLLFGEEYKDAGSLLQILLIGAVFSSHAKIIANYFSASNQLHFNSIVSIIILIINITLNVFLVPVYGLTAAAFVNIIVCTINYTLKNLIIMRTESRTLSECFLVRSKDIREVLSFIGRK